MVNSVTTAGEHDMSSAYEYYTCGSDIVVYMCMEVIICQSDMSPERLMISQTPSIGGTSNQLRWEKECGGNSPSFWGYFYKTHPTQNWIFQTFQNCGVWTFYMSVFVNMTNMVVNSDTDSACAWK